MTPDSNINRLRVLIFFVLVLITSSYQLSRIGTSRTLGQQWQQKSRMQLFDKVTYKVTVQHDGKETVLDVREDMSILSCAIDAGIDLPHDCDMGVCLTCPSRIVSGEVEQPGGTLDDSVIEQGFALTCCSFPRSDVVIRSIDEEELLAAQFSDRS